MGEVKLEVSLVCEPCEQSAALRPGLQEQMVGKRGMLCRVLRGGTVKRGDSITAEERDSAKSEVAECFLTPQTPFGMAERK